METATFITVVQIASACVVIVATAYNVARTGKASIVNDAVWRQSVDTGIRGLEDKLNHPDYGLTAIQQKLNNIERKCAECQSRLGRAEHDIQKMNGKP